jgi:hypothetical protein
LNSIAGWAIARWSSRPRHINHSLNNRLMSFDVARPGERQHQQNPRLLRIEIDSADAVPVNPPV